MNITTTKKQIAGQEVDDKWTKVDAYREMKVLENGKVLVVRPLEASSTIVPLFCPLCSFPMRTLEDSISYRKSQCCEQCFLFCRGNREELPYEQWEEYIIQRQTKPKQLIKFK